MHRRGNIPWPGHDEKAVIDDMLADGESLHWNRCYELVEQLTRQWAGGLPVDLREEITQNAMIKVMLYLPAFKQQSKLSTWLVRIVRSCKADEFRKNQQSHTHPVISLNKPLRNDEGDEESIDLPASLTAEQELEMREELHEIFNAILEFLAEHGKQERNSEIIGLYLDGYNHQKITLQLGIPAPVVGYVIRSMQRYAREFRQHQPPSSLSHR